VNHACARAVREVVGLSLMLGYKKAFGIFVCLKGGEGPLRMVWALHTDLPRCL